MQNKYVKLFLLVSFMIFSVYSYSQTLKYSTPVDKSSYNMESTNIILGFDYGNNQKSVKLNVQGSVSGYHSGRIKIINAKQLKVSFIPDEPFALGEKVTVSGYNRSDKIEFYIRKKAVSNVKNLISESLNSETKSLKPVYNQYPLNYYPLDTLPPLIINQYGQTASGELFMINFNNLTSLGSYLMILRDDGSPKFSQKLRYRGYDFKKQNDYYIYWDEDKYFYRALDTAFNLIDSFYCGNGYITNFHECILTPDNSAWLLSYDPQVVDMSQIYPGGMTNATVTGLIIQKISPHKDVVFQWRSWDHMSILDATHEDFTAYNIDYVHGNSLDIDNDSNIILSSRHLDEISKINSTTGEFIWRLGGKHNEFTFVNDTAKFSHQHYVRRLANNNILFFDNGNYHTPNYSRAVEYSMNETAKTVELVWEYRNTPTIYSSAMGNAQRLENGNTMIGWGLNDATLTEVTPDKSVLYTLSLPTGQYSYRSVRYNTTDVATNTLSDNNSVSNYKLSQNYPNPFNPATRINFALPKSGFVTLKVYNLIGQEVASLVNEEKNVGTYSVDFNASNLTSGIYFYKVSVNGFSEVKKMMLIK
jgi:hypothetical protein